MSALDTAATSGSMAPSLSTPALGAKATRGIALGLVAIALLAWLASVAIFVTHPLDELPLYFARRYLVLDPTSLLFVLVINTVFLGISVYMLSRERTSTLFARDIRFRAAMTVLFMVVMNLGVMSNHLILMWALIELSTLCAAPLVARGEFKSPKTAAWRYMLYSAMTLAITFLGFMCLSQSADLRGIEIVSFGVSSVKASEEDEQMIKQMQQAKAYMNPGMAAANLARAQANAMQDAAKNQGGSAMAFMGMNMAQNVGGFNAQNLYQMGAQQQPQQTAAPAANGWTCPQCGTVSTGKFCSSCGTKKPEPAAANTWTCSCGAVNKGKFCSECGAKKPAGVPQYKCDKCGWEPADPTHPPKFCPECGDPFDGGDIVG